MYQNSSSKQAIIIGTLSGALVLAIGAIAFLYFQEKNNAQVTSQVSEVKNQSSSNNMALSKSEELSKTPNILSKDEQVAIFQMVGAIQREDKWVIIRDDKDEPAGTAVIERSDDLNGDGRPEALVIDEGGSYYGNTGQEFTLLSKQGDGSWKVMVKEIAIPKFLETRGVDGWPDIELGGPGMEFPVIHWNGKEYINQGNTDAVK